MESTKFHTVDGNSLGRSVDINKFVHSSTPNSTKAGVGAISSNREMVQGGFRILETFRKGRSLSSIRRNSGNSRKHESSDSLTSVTR